MKSCCELESDPTVSARASTESGRVRHPRPRTLISNRIVNASKQFVRPEESAAGRDVIHAPAAITLTSLTGRDTEVSLLRDRWEQAQEGMGQVVSIVGEPGLGKSRLLHTIKQIVTEQGSAKVPAAETEALDVA